MSIDKGESISADTVKRWEGFRVGDIITCSESNQSSILYNREAVVRVIFQDGLIFSYMGVIDCFPRYEIRESQGIILLSRPGLPFRVGDLVKDERTGVTGCVIVINPYEYIDERCLLVEFVSNIVAGHNAFVSWVNPWYPKEYRTDLRRRFWMCAAELILYSNENRAPVPELMQNQSVENRPGFLQSQPVEDKWQGQKKIVERIFAELEARLKQGEYPVFEPQDLRIVDAEVLEIKSSRQARNLRECLRLLGATLFHLVNAESEFDMECYIVDADLAYRKKMPAGDFGALVDELLFGEKCTVEKIRGMIA